MGVKKKAVALGYNAHDVAPTVRAKGNGYTAKQIIERARQAGVHIHEDADLAEVLSAFNISDFIPEELYETVAGLLIFVYKQNNEFRNSEKK